MSTFTTSGRFTEEEMLQGSARISLECFGGAEGRTEFSDVLASDPGRMLTSISKLEKQDRDLALSYWLLKKTQYQLSDLHGETQTRISTRLRDIQTRIARVLTGVEPYPFSYRNPSSRKKRQYVVMSDDPDCLGQFRIDLCSPGIDKLFTPQANLENIYPEPANLDKFGKLASDSHKGIHGNKATRVRLGLGKGNIGRPKGSKSSAKKLDLLMSEPPPPDPIPTPVTTPKRRGHKKAGSKLSPESLASFRAKFAATGRHGGRPPGFKVSDETKAKIARNRELGIPTCGRPKGFKVSEQTKTKCRDTWAAKKAAIANEKS